MITTKPIKSQSTSTQININLTNIQLIITYLSLSFGVRDTPFSTNKHSNYIDQRDTKFLTLPSPQTNTQTV